MHSIPGVITAVAGSTEMQLDQRHLDPNELAAMFAEAQQACRSAAEEFNCTVEQRDVFHAAPTPFDATLSGERRAVGHGDPGRARAVKRAGRGRRRERANPERAIARRH